MSTSPGECPLPGNRRSPHGAGSTGWHISCIPMGTETLSPQKKKEHEMKRNTLWTIGMARRWSDSRPRSRTRRCARCAAARRWSASSRIRRCRSWRRSSGRPGGWIASTSARCQERAQGDAGEELHDQVGPPAGQRPGVGDLDDARVLRQVGGPRLIKEAAQHQRVRGEPRVQHLERHAPPHPLVDRLVHGPHAALPRQPQHAIAADPIAICEELGLSRTRW